MLAKGIVHERLNGYSKEASLAVITVKNRIEDLLIDSQTNDKPANKYSYVEILYKMYLEFPATLLVFKKYPRQKSK